MDLRGWGAPRSLCGREGPCGIRCQILESQVWDMGSGNIRKVQQGKAAPEASPGAHPGCPAGRSDGGPRTPLRELAPALWWCRGWASVWPEPGPRG